MATYLITGASRGIGLELTKQLLELPVSKVSKVFATTRGDLSGPLQSLVNNNPQRAVHVVAAINDTKSVQNAAEQVKEHLGGQGLDVLINNAGIVTYNPDGVASVAPEEFARVFDVNVLGAQRVIVAFLPLLKMGQEKKVINM
jgi:NAD(P)-dependent dehydrogenase (short-subunit alcohol dehydrogenase family)